MTVYRPRMLKTVEFSPSTFDLTWTNSMFFRLQWTPKTSMHIYYKNWDVVQQNVNVVSKEKMFQSWLFMRLFNYAKLIIR